MMSQHFFSFSSAFPLLSGPPVLSWLIEHWICLFHFFSFLYDSYVYIILALKYDSIE